MMKNFRLYAILSIIIAFCSCTSKETQLVQRGKAFILDQVISPSTTTFISHTSSDKIEALLCQWGVQLEEKHDALMIEIETTNGFGGRVRKNLCVFFVNGNPVEYADADDLNRVSIHQYITAMKDLGKW